MTTYNNIKNYLQDAKVNDIIVFHGNGLLNHLPTHKYDTYKVVSIEPFKFRAYRGRKNLATDITDQKVSVVSKKEFELMYP